MPLKADMELAELPAVLKIVQGAEGLPDDDNSLELGELWGSGAGFCFLPLNGLGSFGKNFRQISSKALSIWPSSELTILSPY